MSPLVLPLNDRPRGADLGAPGMGGVLALVSLASDLLAGLSEPDRVAQADG